MTLILFVLIALIVSCFSFVLLFGAPYLPTRKTQIAQVFDALNLKGGENLLELGAGSGGLTIEAAKRGIHVTAYEINPLLAAVIWLRARKYKKYITVRLGNFWNAPFGNYDYVYAFLLDPFMERLDDKMIEEASKGALLASYTFKIPGRKEDGRLGPIFVYKY